MPAPFHVRGSIVALVTPMHADGSVDHDALRRLVDWHIAEGTDCIGVVGTTGESPTVDVAEHCEIIRIAVEQGSEELCVIGGGEVYALTLGRADVLHLTEVDTEVEGAHAFFPAFDPAEWHEVAREPHPADAKHAIGFDFVEYRPTPTA